MSDPATIDPTQGSVDELQAWYLAKGAREGLVYAQVVQRLIRRLYRDRDYLAKRKTQGQHTTYDYTTEQDVLAIAWAVRALVRFVPGEVQAEPLPERPARVSPRPPRQSKATYRPPARAGWEGVELPPDELLTKKRPKAT